MKTFIAGGGLGDCILILNKFKQLAAPQDKLIYYLAKKQSGSRPVIQEFWQSQNVHCEIQIVPEIATLLNHHDPAFKKLNPLTYGAGFIMVEKWKFVFYPFDTFATPTLQLESNPSPYEHYFVVQSDAGTMKYRGHKNWLHTEWIDDFVAAARATGLKCILLGTKDVGIQGADYVHYNIPLKDLFGIIKQAEFVLGLQGFVTVAALMMQKKVLLKRENLRVILNYFHPGWRRHGKVFSEPDQWKPAKTRQLLNWALANDHPGKPDE
jgi:hypothetical protein